ncbi:MAG: adenylate/guanylate cyclase domain-containing protein [Thermoproteota archaeon]|nr:adenylate/guanylate cyclase domain-containing protein [Thermoproteota archaeon]
MEQGRDIFLDVVATNEQDSEGEQDKTSKTVFNMMMATNNDSRNVTETKIVDSETLVAQTQDRLWRALKRHFQYDVSLQPSQEYLLNHVSSKIPLVIMYADLVGSTNMSMTLPADKLTTIIRAFTYEMSQVIYNHKGYVLKYVGDAVISFFPASYNKLLACDRAVQCAKSMLAVVKNGINPILNQYDYPELNVKIGMDEGENVIVQYGHDRSSQIDILGYHMNIAAKITSLTGPNKISIGEYVYKMLHPSIKSKFKNINFNTDEWRYTDRHTGQLYKVYAMSDGTK